MNPLPFIKHIGPWESVVFLLFLSLSLSLSTSGFNLGEFQNLSPCRVHVYTPCCTVIKNWHNEAKIGHSSTNIDWAAMNLCYQCWGYEISSFGFARKICQLGFWFSWTEKSALTNFKNFKNLQKTFKRTSQKHLCMLYVLTQLLVRTNHMTWPNNSDPDP